MRDENNKNAIARKNPVGKVQTIHSVEGRWVLSTELQMLDAWGWVIRRKKRERKRVSECVLCACTWGSMCIRQCIHLCITEAKQRTVQASVTGERHGPNEGFFLHSYIGWCDSTGIITQLGQLCEKLRCSVADNHASTQTLGIFPEDYEHEADC